MKISDLIAKLEKIKEERGDNDITFGVRDYYSIYDTRINPSWKVDSAFWEGTLTREGETKLSFNIGQNEEGKNPKITFRKG